MMIKYFQDTEAPCIKRRSALLIPERPDIDENTALDPDASGNRGRITGEQAIGRADAPRDLFAPLAA